MYEKDMSISLKSGAEVLVRLPSLKHHNALKQNSTFTLELNTVNNTHYIKKRLQNKSCWALNLLQKSQMAHMPISPGSGASGLQRFICYKYYIAVKQESRFTLELKTVEITDYIRKCFKLKLLSIKILTKKSVDAHVHLPQEWS